MPSSSPPSLRTSPGWQGNLPVWGSCRGTTPTERGSLPLLHFCPVLHQGVCGIQESRSGSLGARSCGSFTRTIRISSGFIKVHTGWHNSHTIDSPLLPVMHWPTFLQLLMSREDERSQTWRAYLLSLGASLHNLNHYTSLSAAIPRMAHRLSRPLLIYPQWHILSSSCPDQLSPSWRCPLSATYTADATPRLLHYRIVVTRW